MIALSPSLQDLLLFHPDVIQQRARVLREKSIRCADLASDCITSEARCTLSGMAAEYRSAADELEGVLLKLRKQYADSPDDHSATLVN
jgi:hypothetical protein